MNQQQRKYLLEAIEKQYKTERDRLDERKPEEPSLNNYLIAAILDGSFVMRAPAEVRALLVECVRSLGKSEALLEEGSSWRSRREDGVPSISLPALTLFEMPVPYAKAHAAYGEALRAWTAEKDALEASIGAMRIKVQIGSDKALEALVEQADKLCSMSLTASNRLLLGNSDTKIS